MGKGMGKGMTKTMRRIKKNTKKSRKYRKKQLSFRRGGETSSTSEEENNEDVPDKAEPEEKEKKPEEKEKEPEKKKSPSEEVKDKLQLTKEEEEEMIGFKKVIDVFLQKEQTTPTLKYAMNQSNFEKYSNDGYENEREEYELTRDLTHLIIKDDAHNMFFDAEVASFQVLIDNMYKYLTSFQSVQHDLKIDYYLKSLVNGKPFVRVTHNVNGYNTIHDVNNLLAYIQNEYNKNENIDKNDLQF